MRGIYHPGWCAPGVIRSTVEETTLFFDRLLDGQLLQPGSLSKMLQLVRVPGNHPPAVSPGYGLGIMGDPDGALGASYGHGGGGPGYQASASILPWQDAGRLCVAVFCNTSAVSGLPELERNLLGKAVGARLPA